MLIPFAELCSKYAIRPKFVAHLGANQMQEADDYARNGVEQVVWIEAIPAICKQCETIVSKYSNNVVLCACLSDVDNLDVDFHVSSNEGQSSSVLAFGTHAQAHPEVKFTHDLKLRTVRFDTLAAVNGITIPAGSMVNIDVQGFELKVLRGMGELLHKFDHAYIEINVKPLYVGCPMADEIDAYLAGFGFATIETKLTGWGWGDRYYARTK